MTSSEAPPPIGADNIEWIIVCVYLSFLSVLGTAGNALVLIVFYRKKDKQVSTFFILVLAMVDLTTCLVLIPCTIWMEYWDFRISQDFVCKSYMMLNGGMIHFSALIMVAIALERYLSICHPFLRILTLKRSKFILVALASVATALGICIALTHGVIHDLMNEFQVAASWNVSATSRFSGISTSERSWLEATRSSDEFNRTSQGHNPQLHDVCHANDLLLSHEFQIHFQRLSNTLYLVYLAIVIVLYALIYKSVMTRRARRQKQKSACLMQVRQAQEKAKMAERIAASVQANSIELHCMKEKHEIKAGDSDNNTFNNTCLEPNITILTKTTAAAVRIEEESTASCNQQNPQHQQQGQRQGQLQTQQQSRRQRQKKQMVDGTMLANMKTAAMLFVVTVVFFVTFTPAFLSATELIAFKAYLFYLYFANNVANPIIYSFMNRNFRTDLKKLFCNKV